MRMAKKYISLLLALCMLLTALPMSTFAALSKTPPILYGDVNSDEKVDITDVFTLKKYLAEHDVQINKEAADVNKDKSVNMADLLLLKKYLAGWDVVLGPDLCKITFDTDGGVLVDPISVKEGSKISNIPTTSKDGYIFTGWYTSDGAQFFAEDVIKSDLKLIAKYEKMAAKEDVNLSSFALEKQDKTLSYIIVSKGNETAEEIKNKIKLTPMDGSGAIELDIVKNADNTFTVKAKDGFNEGASYQLTLNEELNFKDKPDSIRTASFTIDKEEVDNLALNDDMIFIKDTDDMSYTIKGENVTVPVLESAIINSDTNDAVEGYFEYNATVTIGDVLCIYEIEDPRTRDYAAKDYKDDAVAYVEVIKIEGITVHFKSLDEEDADKVIAMPDSIPFSMESLPIGNTGTIQADKYDTTAWKQMGKTDAPQYDKGDFVIMYQSKFFDMTEETPVYYGKIITVSETELTFVKVTADDIKKSMDMFVETPVDGDELLENVDTAKLTDKIKLQVLNSGFAEDAAAYLGEMATKTDGFKNITNLKDLSMTDSNGNQLSPAQLKGIGGTIELSDDVKVTVELDSSSKYFGDGIRLAVGIEAEFGIDIGDGGDQVKIDLKATFVEEVAVGVDVKVDTEVFWLLFVPIIYDLSCSASVDLKNYSGISVDVKIYTVAAEEESLWEQLKSIKGEFAPVFDKIEQIEEIIAKGKETADKIQQYKQDIEKLYNELPAGVEKDFKSIVGTLGELNITKDLLGLLNLTNETELDAGVQDLMDRYSEMLANESDWIEIVNKPIIDKTVYVKVIAINFKVSFVIKANINIALGANMEYVVGKRYSFWVDVFKGKSGSSEMDLLDERFAFQFYVMGHIGLKMGVEVEIAVGILSTKLASIGATVEFGPYVKLWGYFIYEYSKMRPANTSTWDYDEQMMGALYLEFGIYLEVTFKAQALDGKIKYEPTLVDKEWPLLTAGVRNNVYDFGYEIEEDEILLIDDNDDDSKTGINMSLPESFMQMNYIDLVEGNKEQAIYPNSKFNYRLSNRNFKFDPKTGLITVNVPKDVQYMECDLTLTWKTDKLAFSSHDLSITIPLVWTNLATDELKEKFTASVKVGNEKDGYTTVWSDRVNKNQPFNLPKQDEIKKLLNYDNYEVPGLGNLKYEKVTGYGNQKTEDLIILTDKSFYFDVTPRQYELIINGVQNKDGKTENAKYTAKFGESFNLDSLKQSGANDDKLKEYTTFFKVEATDMFGDTINFDASRIIDTNYAKQLLSNAKYQAKYQDNSAIITYKFEGIDLAEKTIKIKKGTTPPDIFTKDVLAKNAIVTSVNPAIGPVLSSTVYTIVCKSLEKPIVTHTLSYETNGGSSIAKQEYPEGSKITPPTQPTKEGYEFGGWYSDKELSIPFIFETMPERDTTIYAKWIGKQFSVTFDANEGTLPENIQNPIKVTFGETYGNLYTPTRAGFAFLGWYTDRVGGVQITADKVVSLTENQTLYARWGQKQEITEANIQITPNQVTDYNTSNQPLDFKITGVFATPESFKVQYKRQGIDANWGDTAINAGVYDVKITRSEDVGYAYFEKTYVGIKKINKIQRTIKAPTLSDVYKSNILADLPQDAYLGDGKVQYAAIAKSVIGSPLFQIVLNTSWQDSKAIMNKMPNDYVLFARVLEGENYFKAVSEKGAEAKITEYPVGSSKTKYSYIGVKTSNIDDAGTDAVISGRLYYFDGYKTSLSSMDNDGNDHEQGSYGDYAVPAQDESNGNVYPDPWMISQIGIDYVKKWAAAGWHCEYVKAGSGKIRGYIGSFPIHGPSVMSDKVGVDKWFTGKNEYETYSNGGSIPSMKRKITSVSNFSKDILGSLNLTSGTNDVYSFTYDGMVKDQYIADGYITNSKTDHYNAYEHFDAPMIGISADKTGYENCYDYKINSFSVDKKALYEQMKKNGEKEINLTVTLKFPERSTTSDTAIWTKTIKVTCDDAPQSRQSQNNEQNPINVYALIPSFALKEEKQPEKQ